MLTNSILNVRNSKDNHMNILDIAIVSNTEMIKNYKGCRNKAENLSKIFILKNNEPDAVLFSINSYKKHSAFIEYLDSLEEADLLELNNCLPQCGNNEMSKLKELIKDLQENEKAMAAGFDQGIAEVNMKMDQVKDEVVGGHNTILGEIKNTSEGLSKKIKKL